MILGIYFSMTLQQKRQKAIEWTKLFNDMPNEEYKEWSLFSIEYTFVRNFGCYKNQIIIRGEDGETGFGYERVNSTTEKTEGD